MFVTVIHDCTSTVDTPTIQICIRVYLYAHEYIDVCVCLIK